MENVLFKVSYPAEFHAQTAVEAAIKIHPQVKDRLSEIESVKITTHEAAIRIIDKKEPLRNPADRDHCLQYMTAIALIFGNLKAEDYEEKRAMDPRIDDLRRKMIVSEKIQYTRNYYDPNKRSITNTVQVFFREGAPTKAVTVEYPLGHRRRRREALPFLEQKFIKNMSTIFPQQQVQKLLNLFRNHELLENLPVSLFMDNLRI
jgi:2-methylcitrate dehydratase PrpD